jgi:pilus assembly protein CpaE
MSVDEIIMDTDGRTKAEIVVFISAKGGVGKTITSVNTAAVLAGRGFSVCILDGNFQFGDVNLALDIQSSFTISDLIEEAENLNSLKISYYLDKHSSGLNVLSAPAKPEQAELITSSHIKTICRKLLEQHDFLIVDLPSGLSESNLTFMELASRVMLVTDSTFAAVKNTKTMLRTINMLGMNEKVRVVVNQSEEQSVINAKDVKSILEVKNVSIISNNSKLVSKSFAAGTPFVISKPKEKISKDILELAEEICGKN